MAKKTRLRIGMIFSMGERETSRHPVPPMRLNTRNNRKVKSTSSVAAATFFHCLCNKDMMNIKSHWLVAHLIYSITQFLNSRHCLSVSRCPFSFKTYCSQINQHGWINFGIQPMCQHSVRSIPSQHSFNRTSNSCQHPQTLPCKEKWCFCR